MEVDFAWLCFHRKGEVESGQKTRSLETHTDVKPECQEKYVKLQHILAGTENLGLNPGDAGKLGF